MVHLRQTNKNKITIKTLANKRYTTWVPSWRQLVSAGQDRKCKRWPENVGGVIPQWKESCHKKWENPLSLLFLSFFSPFYGMILLCAQHWDLGHNYGPYDPTIILRRYCCNIASAVHSACLCSAAIWHYWQPRFYYCLWLWYYAHVFVYIYIFFCHSIVFDLKWLHQNTLKNLKCITSSHAFQLVRDQIEKSKSEVQEYQALYEKLQVVTGR
jgi:hypothetical protein